MAETRSRIASVKTGDGGTVGSIVIDTSLSVVDIVSLLVVMIGGSRVIDVLLPGTDGVSLLVVDVVSEDSSVDVSSSVRAFSVVSVVVSDGGREGEVGGVDSSELKGSK